MSPVTPGYSNNRPSPRNTEDHAKSQTGFTSAWLHWCSLVLAMVILAAVSQCGPPVCYVSRCNVHLCLFDGYSLCVNQIHTSPPNHCNSHAERNRIQQIVNYPKAVFPTWRNWFAQQDQKSEFDWVGRCVSVCQYQTQSL